MESRWHLLPGQTPENTKISDRAHALHITSSNFDKITQHLDRKARIQEALNAEKAHKTALKQGSEAMTKLWPNSIESLRLAKESQRCLKTDDKEEVKIQKFYKMRAEQEDVRKEYVNKINTKVFRSSGYPRELTSALVLSETLYERGKQREFDKILKQHEDEVNQKFVEQILASDAKQKADNENKEKAKLEVEKRVALEIKQQIKERADTWKHNNEKRIQQDTEDRINAAKEDELLKEFELSEKMKLKAEAKKEKEEALLENKRRQKMADKEEAELKRATQFYSDAKKKIDCLMKQKEVEYRTNLFAARDALARKVAVVQESKEEEEEGKRMKAIADQNEKETLREDAKLEAKRQNALMRRQDREEFLHRREKEQLVENEVKKWEMLNRRKQAEAMKEYNNQSNKDKWAKILAYRQELLDQIDQTKESIRKDQEIDQILSRVDYTKSDDMFFQYANEVLDLARSKNRSTYPIDKVIAEYQKVNNLVVKDRHCRCCEKTTKNS